MADFTLKKRKDFVFALEEDPEKTYTLPALKSLSFEDAGTMTKIDDEKQRVSLSIRAVSEDAPAEPEEYDVPEGEEEEN